LEKENQRRGGQAMIVGKDHKMPKSHCTACGYEIDAATCVGVDTRPKPDDITICIDCGHIMAFAKNLTLKDLTDSEIKEVAGDARIVAIQWARGEAKKKVRTQ
jgi:hypothetical protein